MKEEYKKPLEVFKARRLYRDVPSGYICTRTGRWTPSEAYGERQPCCAVIEGTESQSDYMLTHCMSARHIGYLCGLKGKDLGEFADYAACVVFADELSKGDADGYEEI